MANERQAPFRRSFIGPIMLIALGVIFLLSNLNLVQRDLGSLVWRLWPVIFIALGLDSLFRERGVAGPVFFLTLGGMFLLRNFDLVEGDVWWLLIRLWPVLLIAVGLDFILRRRSLVGAVLAVAFILALLAFSLGFFNGSFEVEGIRLLQHRPLPALIFGIAAVLPVRGWSEG